MLVTANIFQPLIDVFQSVITFYHSTFGVSWGLAIVMLTISVRLVLVPLAVKQIHSMRAMQQHQPELKAIQRKYKDDKQRQQEEMMKFYRENNINPFASCLPMAAQLPVFISLYYMLRKNLRADICPIKQETFQAAYAKTYMHLHNVSAAVAHQASLSQTTACGSHAPGAGFLFIPDITAVATGATLVILIILYVGTQISSTLLMATPTMDKTQQRLMLFLPLIFVFFIIRFPAGLILYWITTNAWTMFQQYTIKRMMGPTPVAAVGPGLADDDEDSGGGLRGLLSGLGPRGGGNGGGGGSGGRNGSGDRGSSGGSKGSPAGSKAGAERGPAKPPPSSRTKKKRSGRRR
jgi:YidC/Oxa1 family membrane protein insertase